MGQCASGHAKPARRKMERKRQTALEPACPVLERRRRGLGKEQVKEHQEEEEGE